MADDQLDVAWMRTASRRQKWLVGVSGGADSVALLHLMIDSGFRNVVVCHLHHGLRGIEADEDAMFVKRLAKRLGYTFEMERVDVGAAMRELKQSMETAARLERLAFFTRVAHRHRCRRIVLAHHADDQAETVLWNLLRGANGLRGMKGESTLEVGGVELTLYRPLLKLRHAELEDWLRVKRRKWREDSSNQLPVAVRNRLRNEALPLLAEIAGRDAVVGLARLAEDFSEWDEFMHNLVRERSVLDPQGRIHLGALRSLPVVLQRVALVDYLKANQVPQVSRALVDEALEMLESSSAATVNLPGGGRLRRTSGRFWIDG